MALVAVLLVMRLIANDFNEVRSIWRFAACCRADAVAAGIWICTGWLATRIRPHKMNWLTRALDGHGPVWYLPVALMQLIQRAVDGLKVVAASRWPVLTLVRWWPVQVRRALNSRRGSGAASALAEKSVLMGFMQ
jgi:hypothetical protein